MPTATCSARTLSLAWTVAITCTRDLGFVAWVLSRVVEGLVFAKPSDKGMREDPSFDNCPSEHYLYHS